MDPAINENKEDMRARYLSIRNGLNDERRIEAKMRLANEIVSLPEFKDAQTLYVYDPFGSELDINPIIESAWNVGIAVAFPKCHAKDRTMTWHVVHQKEQMQRSPMGMREPAFDERTQIKEHSANSIALVPGVVFDNAGNRIGYGGGYYDRFLPEYPGLTIGVCFNEQRTKTIDCLDGLDIAMDRVISA